jgi:hypothetical protein
MVLFLKLLASGIVVITALVLPISYWMAKLLNQEPPDLTRLFRRHRATQSDHQRALYSPVWVLRMDAGADPRELLMRPSIGLANIETHVAAANTVVQKHVRGPRPVPMGGVSPYVAGVTIVQAQRRIAL